MMMMIEGWEHERRGRWREDEGLTVNVTSRRPEPAKEVDSGGPAETLASVYIISNHHNHTDRARKGEGDEE